jgi:hypothetical protein
MVVVSSGKSTTMTSFLDASNFLPVEPVLMMTKIITKDCTFLMKFHYCTFYALHISHAEKSCCQSHESATHHDNYP